jgi:hypothetical protein
MADGPAQSIVQRFASEVIGRLAVRFGFTLETLDVVAVKIEGYGHINIFLPIAPGWYLSAGNGRRQLQHF